MSFAVADTAFGRRLGRVFDRCVWPIVIILLAWGQYSHMERIIEASRRSVTAKNAQSIGRTIKREAESARLYSFGTAAVCVLLWLIKSAGRRKIQRLGNEMEGLTAQVLHDQSRAFGDINAEANAIIAHDAEPSEAARRIEAVSSAERKKIAAYMRLARDFKGFDEAESEDVNLAEAAWRIVSDVKSRVSHVDIRFNVPQNDVIVHTHPFFVSEIVGNLLDNAVKYTESGEVALSVAEDNGKAKIVVSDTGCGISPQDRKHIFERFYRAPSASAKPGSGLGLATVYEIVVKLLKGRIDCRSEVGSGTIFTVTLPLATSQRNT